MRRDVIAQRAIIVLVCAWLCGIATASLFETTRPAHRGLRTNDTSGERVVTWVQPGGPEWDRGIRPGDIHNSVDDDPSPSPILADIPQRVAFIAIASCFAIIGAGLFLRAPKAPFGQLALGVGAITATCLLAALATPFGVMWALVLVFLCALGFGFAVLMLALVVPVNRIKEPWAQHAVRLSAMASAVVAALYAAAFIDPSTYGVVQRALLGLVTIELLTAVGLVVVGVVRRPRADTDFLGRGGLRLVALGTVVGLAPFCLLSIGPYALGLGYVLAPEVAITGLALVPVGVAAAIAGQRWAPLAGMVRRGLVAALVWVTMLASYAVALTLLEQVSAALFGSRLGSIGWVAVTVLVVAATFPMLQDRARRALERRLFHDVYGYAETLRDLAGAIAQLSGADAVATGTLARLGNTLDLSWAAIVLPGTNGQETATYRWGTAPASLNGHGTSKPQGVSSSNGGGRPWRLPLVAEMSPTGELIVGPKRRGGGLSSSDTSLVVTLAPLLAVALENASLVRQLRAQVDALGSRERELAALSARLLRVQEDERQRLALDLHDEPLQRAILLARELRSDGDWANHSRWLRAAEDIADSLRAICTGLRPPALDDFGLVAGLERLVLDVRTRSDLLAHLEVSPAEPLPRRLPIDLEVALYRVAQEAISNTLKHAQASTVRLSLEWHTSGLRLRIEDDGHGFSSHAVGPTWPSTGLGLLGMRERLRPWGGHVEYHPLDSCGTEIVAEVDDVDFVRI